MDDLPSGSQPIYPSEDEVKLYFTSEDWSSMNSYEKKSYGNILHNYYMMKHFGLNPTKPSFMSLKSPKPDRKRSSGKKHFSPPMKNVCSTSKVEQAVLPQSSDMKSPVTTEDTELFSEDLKESSIHLSNISSAILLVFKEIYESLKNGSDCKNINDLAKPVTAVSKGDENNPQKFSKPEVVAKKVTFSDSKSKPNKIDGEAEKSSDCDQEHTRRYPRRSVPVQNYTESELLQDDDYIFCDSCDMEYEGDCPEHGPLTYFADNYTPITGDENQAERTTPGIMKVSKSKIPGAGAGVWTVIGLPLHAKMGPYQGDKSDTPDPLGYSWTIMKNKKVDHYIRASSTVNSNWMRFVNCARHESEQNLMAFQYKGKMYYRTVRRIPPKSELLVWYGKDYAEKLGISLKSFRDPNTAHLTSMVFPCSNCKMTYTSPLYLEKHEKTCYIKDGPRLSVEADKVPTDMTSLGRVSEGRTVYYCPYCKYQTTYSGNIRLHLLTHSGVKPFKCDVCGKGFTHAGLVNRHQLIHTGDRPYKCTECCYSSNYSSALRFHMAARHTGERIYGCSECKYTTVQSHNMTKHMRTHTGVKPYKCDVCGKGFTQAGNLASHQRIHTGDKPYKCTECCYSSNYSSALRSHMAARHTGERIYGCSECKYRTVHCHNMTKHMRTHTGVKPYKCDVCGKGFTQAGNLASHQRIHTGDKPYKCTECCYSSNYSSALRSHIAARHTGERII